MSYPSHYGFVGEIEYAIEKLRWVFPGLCEVIELPHRTGEKRTVLAVRVGKKPARKVGAILITGNVHARELGGAEFCCCLIYDLCQAYEHGTGLDYGGKSYSVSEVRFVIEELNLIVVPCVNPDGREWSLIGALEGNHEKALWRGNRNHAGSCYGVDLNRNQDFLWDHELHFDPNALMGTTSDPCSSAQTYRGKAPASEPETQNLVWLMEEFPTIYCYLDVHCHYGALVHPWGDDTIQSNKPDMNFGNAAYDGLRNPNGGAYREYMPEADLATFRKLGRAFRDALKDVRGNQYDLMPAAELAPDADQYGHVTFRATSGANDDYAYSRHLRKKSKMKIFSFTVEYGERAVDGSAVGAFQPPFPEMASIIEELIAGTLALCIEARSSLPNAPALLGCLKNAAIVVGVIAFVLVLLKSCGSAP